MSVEYTYQKQIYSKTLLASIAASSITIAMDHIDTYYENQLPYAHIYFKAALSNDEKTTLDTIVASHDPTPPHNDDITEISPMLDEMNRPCVRVDSRDDHDTTVFTIAGDKWTTVAGEAVGTGDGVTKTFYLGNKEVRSVTAYLDGTPTEAFTVDYSAYENNNKALHFSRGVVTFAVAPAAGVVITADYQYATMGNGNKLIFDFSTDTSPKVMEVQFCDPIHVKDGLVFFQNGEIDSTINMYIVAPAGTYYYDDNGNPAYAAADTEIMHYVVDNALMGTATVGVYFDVESRSKAMPNFYKVKMVVNKGTSTTLKGSVRLEINRERTVIL